MKTNKKHPGSVYREGTRGYCGEWEHKGRRYRVRDKTARGARTRLDEVISDVLAARAPLSMRTLGDAFAHFERSNLSRGITGSNQQVSGQTIAGHRWAIARLQAAGGSQALRPLTVRDLEEILREACFNGHEPLSQRSGKQLLTTLNLVLEESERQGQVEKNPTSLVRLPPGLKPPRDKRVLTPSEIALLAREALLESSEARMAFCLLAGLRPGEACALKWDAVSDDGSSIKIRRSRRDEGPEVVVDLTKTDNSRRTIRLTPTLRDFLNRRRRELTLPDGIGVSDLLVFERPEGGVFTRSQDLTLMTSLCRRVGIPRATPRSARRSYATAQANNGVDPYMLAALLGDTVQTVFKHYVVRDTTPSTERFVDLLSDAGTMTPNRSTYNGWRVPARTVAA